MPGVQKGKRRGELRSTTTSPSWFAVHHDPLSTFVSPTAAAALIATGSGPFSPTTIVIATSPAAATSPLASSCTVAPRAEPRRRSAYRNWIRVRLTHGYRDWLQRVWLDRDNRLDQHVCRDTARSSYNSTASSWSPNGARGNATET